MYTCDRLISGGYRYVPALRLSTAMGWVCLVNSPTVLETVHQCWFIIVLSVKHLLVNPHQRACLIRFALILNVVEAVAPLAMVTLMIVVELHLP